MRFYRCHGPYMFDKTSKVFIFNCTCAVAGNDDDDDGDINIVIIIAVCCGVGGVLLVINIVTIVICAIRRRKSINQYSYISGMTKRRPTGYNSITTYRKH